MRSQVTLWHTFVYLWQRNHYTALSPHDPLTPITHYHKNNTNYFFSSLLSALIVSGCQDVSVMSAQSWVTRTRVTTETDISDKNFKDVGSSIIELLALVSSASREETNEWRARWVSAWCEVCHCLYLPNQQSLLCHCPPPAVKMFECPHNTKLTRKWRQYTLFYSPLHQAEHKWR